MTIFSEHARHRMKLRRITEAEVGAALASPDITERSFGGRFIATKKMGRRLLKVVYTEIQLEILVITVYWIQETI